MLMLEIWVNVEGKFWLALSRRSLVFFIKHIETLHRPVTMAFLYAL